MEKITLRFMFFILETLRYILGVLFLQAKFEIQRDDIQDKIDDIKSFHNSVTGFESLFTKQTLRFLDNDQLTANILFTNETLDLMNDNPDVIDWWLKLSPQDRFMLIMDWHFQATMPPGGKPVDHQPA